MVSLSQKNGSIFMENEWERLETNLELGIFSLYDNKTKTYYFKNATSYIIIDQTDKKTQKQTSKEPNTKRLDLTEDYKRTFEIEDVQDEIGKGKKITIKQFNVEFQIILLLEISIYDNDPGIKFVLRLINNGENIIISDFYPFLIIKGKTGAQLEFGKVEDWKIFKIGYQSWSNSGIVNYSSKFRLPNIGWARFPIYNLYNEPVPAGQIRSNYFTVIKNTTTKKNLLIGFLTFKDQLSQILLDFDLENRKLKSIKARSQADGIIIKNGETIKSENLYILFSDDEISSLNSYTDLVSIISDAKKWDHVPTGFSTWYNYYQNISEEDCIKNIKSIKSHKSEIPIEYFQLDDGYEIVCGDWPEPANKKFSNGMKYLADKIKEIGLIPGIWIAPFLVSPISKLYKEHPDWVVRNSKGRPISGGFNPNLYGGSILRLKSIKGLVSSLYVLDTTHPQVQAWLHQLFSKIVNEWGFQYIKIDFIYAAALEGIRYERVTRAQAYRKGIQIIRDAVGDNVFILGCGAPLGPSIGIVNGMRVSCDTAHIWESTASKFLEKIIKLPPSLGLLPALTNDILLSFLHNKWWINDPDCLMVRNKGSKLTLDEVRTQITLIGLSNGIYMISDNLTVLEPDRFKLIKKFIPIDNINSFSPDLFEAENIRPELTLPKFFMREVKTDFDKWYIVGIFNWKDKPINNLIINFSDLKLDINKKYHVYEFWSEKYLGIFEDKFELPSLKKHACFLVRICEVKDFPQLVGSGLHFLQGKAEISSFQFDENSKKLNIELKFKGHNKEKIFIYTPTRLYPYGSENEAINCNCEIIKSEPNYMIVQIEFIENGKIIIDLSRGNKKI